jgi:hypothetical protein
MNRASKAIASLFAVVFLWTAGCKQKPAPLLPASANGATLDMAALNQALSSSSSADVKKSFADFYMRIRYSDYANATADLDKIATDPSLTEAQKKAVTDAQAAVKQMGAGPKPAQ